MVCPVPADEVLDPRCYAPVGIEPRTRALLTAVPSAGALLREGRSSRRQRLFWAVTMRALDGAAAGVHAELRLWPESNPEWFQGRVALLCEADLETISALTLDEQRALLERNLGERSYAALLETAADGLADVGYLEGPRPRTEVPADLPVPPAARHVEPPLDVPEAPLPHPPFALIQDAAGVAALCRQLAGAAAVAVDIETDCGPLGAPPDWSPADGAVRLLQVAARVGDEIVCGVVDCYQVAPRPLLRLLADGREIIAHNARYEQAWLTFHYGLPAWRSIFDTSCAFRVFERHWSIQDPQYARRDATLATVTRRLLGAPKGGYGSDWWGAEPLPAEQLDYAAYDAVALLDLRDRAFALAEAFGCTEQVLAASRTACIEAFRRLPQPRPDAWDAACGLIEGARDAPALARAATVIRRLPLAAWQRSQLRELYAGRRLALAA
ncbi:MAG: ribonuclease [Gaiellales bacterium]|nr:ribonuclease [Gaiellales bacterium]